MRVVNGFHYGMDALDEFNTPDHTDWHAPGRIEKRIDRLVLPVIEQLNERDGGKGDGRDKIDLVQIHSGMWDLVSPKVPSLSLGRFRVTDEERREYRRYLVCRMINIISI